MRRKALILASSCGLLLPLAACERTERQTADERAEVSQKAREIGEKVDEQARQGGEKVAEQVRETNEKIGEAAEKHAEEQQQPQQGEQQMAGAGRYERFEAYENESTETFASRADAAISRLDKDFQQAQQKATTEDAKEDLTDVQDAINEAKKDLADVRGRPGTVIDDGRMGVAMNINQAQRQLSEVYETMSEAQM